MKNNKFNKYSSFFYAFLSGLKISIVGKLASGDLIAIFYSVFSIPSWYKYYSRFPDIRKIHYSLAVFLFFQIISDIYNESSFENSIRGLSNIVVTVLVIMYLTQLLLNNFSSLPLIFIGFSISPLVFGFNIENFGEAGTSLEDMGFFKLVIAPILNSFLFGIILLMSTRKNVQINSKIVAYIFILYGVFCFLFDARSNGMFLILTALIVLNKSILRYLRFKNLVWILPIFLIVFQSLYFVYVEGVLTGSIKSEQTKTQLEKTSNPYNPLNLLASGRVEIFAAIEAISDRPLLGYGSWAKDSGAKYNLILAKISSQYDAYMDNVFVQGNDKDLIIPTHSILTGAWVSGGIFAFFAVLNILYVFLKKVVLLFRINSFRNSLYFPIITFFVINVIWVFLFSPLQELKSVVPLPLVFTIVLFEKFRIRNLKKRNEENNRLSY